MSDRKRSRVVSGSRAQRPIDKELKAVLQAPTTTPGATVLKTTTFPCTVVGLRWSLSAIGNTTTAGIIYWAIVVVKDGNTVNSMAVSDAADFYTPEQNVLAFGSGYTTDLDLAAGPGAVQWEGSTKTMRKLMGGDVLQIISVTDSATAAAFRGVVQFFCKS